VSAPTIGENRFLKSLRADDLARLQPHLTKTSLPRGEVLHPAGEKIEHVYFPLSGMVSIVALMKSGEAIETAVIGREGVVGASVGTNGAKSAGQAVVQIAGSAWQIPGAKFTEAYQASPSLRTLANEFQTVVLLQAQQSAACHALHSVEARLCRWLLQSQDATESDMVPLTQEFLSHMLGVRRTTVSLVAHTLQVAGLIRYSRGQITIINRDGLMDAACECYEVVREYIDKAVPPRMTETAHEDEVDRG
jgi:CRP-like cAMP-binding protein